MFEEQQGGITITEWARGKVAAVGGQTRSQMFSSGELAGTRRRADCYTFFESHSGSNYTTEIGKHCKSEAFLPLENQFISIL